MATLLGEFSLGSSRLVDLMKGGSDVDLPKEGVWQRGPVIDKGSPVLFPVATASVWEDGDVLNACLRVVLIAADGNPVNVWGWRFDSAEQSTDGRPVPRPHAHAQPIMGWYMNSARCLMHPHTPHEASDGCPWDNSLVQPVVNQTHPAFPLLSRTLPGLAVAFVVSLYGVEKTREILEANPALLKNAGQPIKDDILSVLGEG